MQRLKLIIKELNNIAKDYKNGVIDVTDAVEQLMVMNSALGYVIYDTIDKNSESFYSEP